MFGKAMDNIKGNIAKNSIVLVSQPFTYTWNERKFKEVQNLLKKLRERDAFVVFVYYKTSSAEEAHLKLRHYADYFLQLSKDGEMQCLEQGLAGKDLRAVYLENDETLFKKISETLEILSANTGRKTIIFLGGYDVTCVRNYAKYFFFKTQPTTLEQFIILPSLIISYSEQDGVSRLSKDKIVDEWRTGIRKQRVIPIDKVLILKNFKRLL